VTEPIRPVGHQPAVPPPVAPVPRSTPLDRRHRDGEREERGGRRRPHDEDEGDTPPGADGHVDVLA
jgi:hypothetical protein